MLEIGHGTYHTEYRILTVTPSNKLAYIYMNAKYEENKLCFYNFILFWILNFVSTIRQPQFNWFCLTSV